MPALAKPTQTVPELLRKWSERKAELKKVSGEWSEGGRETTDEEMDILQALSLETQDERGGKWFDLVEARKKWDKVDSSIADNKNAGRRGHEGSNNGNGMPTMPHEDPDNMGNGRHEYSLLKVLRHQMDPRQYPLDGVEAECDTEMRKARQSLGLSRACRGTQVPLTLPIDLAKSMKFASRSNFGRGTLRAMAENRKQLAALGIDPNGEERALDTNAGGGSIPTILDTTMIEILRARMVTFNLGARVMTDMQGLFAIPRQSTASTFYMVGQGGTVTASNQTIDQVPFSPHTGGVYTTYTRQFLEQTNQDAEMFVREDQAAVVARGVETQALNGQGSSGYPLGILNNIDVGVYALGTNGAAPTWTQLVAQEAFVAYFNADVGSLAYITDALVRGTLKLTTKVSGSTFPIYLWNTEAPDFPVNGYPCGITNLLPQNLTKGSGSNLHSMIFGNWEDLVYAFWSGMDVIIDPFTSAGQGAVNVVTLQDFDVNIRHYQSFANCVDIISSITAPIT
jgi:HK97 family phage major capsid protein